ncbi:UNVERIFIED_CONTAM: hypothetical protein PYX00_008065 [Menopon gallinae]|uniref:Tr-type G domain-containing protein n=1 Tax=Menopon gallinae TaxID=328185 RepID=A0AAW2HLY8_9NEOP
MRGTDLNKICDLQKNRELIRNICILAHVDHGKTTLADSLVASNGIISTKMAGKLRYMDSRKDEQERGITMKSSAITLLYSSGGSDYLINLIDSPGHVDFSSEVSTAVRLCDGAIVVVDVVEGVCPQTKVALQQAWLENIKPILVLNKIDRYITELKLSPLDAYFKLVQVLEQVNAVMGELFATDVLAKSDTQVEKKVGENETSTYDWSSGLDEADDENLYFSPEQGNVIFASAYDGWAFEIRNFAKLYAAKLGVKEEILNKTLWGDYYLNTKTSKILKGAQEKAKKPLFVRFVLENLWEVYEVAARKDKEKLEKIINSLGIKLTTRDLRHTDYKVQLQAVCSQWLPLAETVLSVVCRKLPSPKEMMAEKAERLMCSQGRTFDMLPEKTKDLRSAFVNCDPGSEAPTIVFVSKMFPVERCNLPINKQRPLTNEELAERREIARRRHEARMLGQEVIETPGDTQTEEAAPEEEVDQEEHVFVAFARVFSGTLREGQELFVLGPKHDPEIALKKINPDDIALGKTLKDLKSNDHITRVKIKNLYLLMGRDLQSLKEAPAGNVVGIGDLEEHILKSGTLSDTLACPSFTELKKVVVPILRVAIEPRHPSDMPQVIKGLRLLNQADAAVQVLVQETGEHVIVTDGEVHLQRCLDDLRERYAKVPINCSEPIVPFRETIVLPPKVDMVNEAIDSQAKNLNEDKIVITTPNKQCTITLRAAPLPSDVVSILEKNSELIRTIDKNWNNRFISDELSKMSLGRDGGTETDQDYSEVCEKAVMTETISVKIAALKKELEKAFAEAGKPWENMVDKIWCFGPKRCGPNILFNCIEGYERNFWKFEGEEPTVFLGYDSIFCNGFQLATLAGPLCEEPMMGVGFIVEGWKITDETSSTGVAYGPLSGQIMSCVKEGCRKAFQAQPQRLMAAMYSCSIQVNAEALGKK